MDVRVRRDGRSVRTSPFWIDAWTKGLIDTGCKSSDAVQRV